jgi:oxygen-independent coproporphyrinogen-3 oxidase
MSNELINKYNVAGPRYTSYPTVPYWDNSPDSQHWMALVNDTFVSSNDKGISLYVHLPFCESLCTYCGCNTRITVNHSVELPYIQTVLKEWKMYLDNFPSRPRIKEIHLGGGTPTFFSVENLKLLIDGILDGADLADDYELGFEGHPNYTKVEQLELLFDLGFRRVSFGVQDFDPKVQYIIHREQSVAQVELVTREARRIGYTSINYDLIYGLPLQTLQSITDTIEQVRRLRPDRIAFYSYAHVPWVKPGQRRFTDNDLPSGEEKRALYEKGRELLQESGYVEIGMDHFSLQTDSLHQATMKKELHRNFMGYTTNDTKLLIGLGVSSIGDSWTGFAQNVKVFEQYVKLVEEGKLPIFKGHILTQTDLYLRRHILNIICNFETEWSLSDKHVNFIHEALSRLSEMEDDGLVIIQPQKLLVTEKGRAFIRNICMAFDARLWEKQPEAMIFSSTV